MRDAGGREGSQFSDDVAKDTNRPLWFAPRDVTRLPAMSLDL